MAIDLITDIQTARIRAQTPLTNGQQTYTTPDIFGEFLPQLAILKLSGATNPNQGPTADTRDMVVGFGATDGTNHFGGYNYGRGQTAGDGQATRAQSEIFCMLVPNSVAGALGGRAQFVSFSQVGGQASITLDWSAVTATFEFVLEIDLWAGTDLQFAIGQTTIPDVNTYGAIVGFQPTAVFGWTCGSGSIDGSAEPFCTHSAAWVAFDPAPGPQVSAIGYACTYQTFTNGTNPANSSSGASSDKWVGQLRADDLRIGWYSDNMQTSNANGGQFTFDVKSVSLNPGGDIIHWIAMRFGDLKTAAGTGQTDTQTGREWRFAQTNFAAMYFNLIMSRNPTLQVGEELFPNNGGLSFFTASNRDLVQSGFGAHSDDDVSLSGTGGTNRSWTSNGYGRILEPSLAGNRPWLQWTITEFRINGVFGEFQVAQPVNLETTWFAIEQPRRATENQVRSIL